MTGEGSQQYLNLFCIKVWFNDWCRHTLIFLEHPPAEGTALGADDRVIGVFHHPEGGGNT